MRRISPLIRILLGRRDFVVLILCNLILGLTYSFVIPFMSIFGTREVGMSPWVFGIFMTITSLSAVILSTLLAKWSDTRWSRKTTLLASSAAGALGYLGYAWVRDARLLLPIGAVLLGISSLSFSQLFAHARNLLDSSDIPPREVPMYMNVFRLFFALSWTVGPALAALVMGRFSFRGTFLVAAGLFALLALVVAGLVPSVPPSAQSKLAAAGLPLRKAFRLPGLLPHFIGFVLIFCCTTMGMMALPLLILNALRGNESNVGLAYSVAPIFEIPFMFFIGVLAMRLENSRLIRAAVILAIVYYAGLSLIRAPWQVYPLQILSAAIVAVTGGIAITFFQDFMPGQAGSATNIYANAQRTGSTLGYLLFGSLSSSLGFRSVFAVCAGFCCVCFLILYRWRPGRAIPAGPMVP